LSLLIGDKPSAQNASAETKIPEQSFVEVSGLAVGVDYIGYRKIVNRQTVEDVKATHTVSFFHITV